MEARFKADGDVIVITGAGNGICRTLAIEAARAGAIVAAVDIDDEKLSSLAAEHENITSYLLDISDRDKVFDTFNAIEGKYEKIDGLVCGAAIQPRISAHETSQEEWLKIQDINLNGVVWCYQAAIQGMIKRQRGSIIAFISGLAHTGWPEASGYAASKAALIAFSKSAAREILPHKVRFNIVSPGVIDTPQFRLANPPETHALIRSIWGIGQPEDVVGPLMFLLSNEASMSGSVLTRDMAFPRSAL